MAIYQPRFITPDVRSGIGLGVIDATQNLTVSWRIQGGSALTSFQIVIYENDAESTQLYTTGQITSGCPAYGTSSNGTPLMFSYTISAADIASAGITNGNEYKLVITQWWSADDSITQSSASVFLTRALPTLTISAIGTGGVIDSRYYTFTGNYSQAQGDILNYFRWQIAYANDTANPFFDTGNISGTMDISCYYDGFFTDTDYAIKLAVQTESGVEADTGWVSFSCSYEVQELQRDITAGCVGGTDAVLVQWQGLGYVPGEAEGDYSISDDNILTLPFDSSITWDTVGTESMSFAAPWTIVWKGKLGFQNTLPIFTLGQSGGNLTLQYPISGHSIRLVKVGSQTVVEQTGIINAPIVTAVLTADTLYLRVEYMSGGLYPASSRYPSDTLYPADDTVLTVATYTKAHSYTQSAITFAEIGGYQECDFFEIINGDVNEAFITEVITNGNYDPSLSTNDYMNAMWTQGINASTVDIGSDTLTGYALYRRQGTDTRLTKVADTTVDIGKVYDYGARTSQGPYTYYLFPVGETTYITNALSTNAVMPCWWNWSLMECEETAEKNIFNVVAAYRFRLNIESAAMSNNNAPSILPNFTPYPKVQLSPQNYKSGTLTGLIGAVYWQNGQPRYKDTVTLMDAIFALSTSHNALFLKNRKGDLIRIRIAGAISMQTGDATREQAQTMSLPWVEVGSTKGVSLYSFEFAGVQEEESECATHYFEGACEE